MFKRRNESQHGLTRGQVTHQQKQQRWQLIILGLGALVVVAALAIVGVGWYINEYRPQSATVLKVGDTNLSMGKLYQLSHYLGQGQSAENIQAIVSQAFQLMEQSELVRQGALNKGITASDSEVNQKLQESDPPLGKELSEVVRAQLLMDKVREELGKDIPESMEQVQLNAMFLEDDTQANQAMSRLKAGEGFADVAAALSRDSSTLEKEGDLGWRPQGVLKGLLGSTIPEGYAFSHDPGSLSDPLRDDSKTKNIGYWLVEVVERKEDTGEAHVQAILLGSEAEARSAKARLDAGEDFTAVAKELTQDTNTKESGGDFGVLTADQLNPVWKEFVADAEIGQVSEPISDTAITTTGGYWLIEVVGREADHPLDEENRNLLKNVRLNEWYTALSTEIPVENLLDEEKQLWLIVKLIRRLG